MHITEEQKEIIIGLIADILEVETEDITDTADFKEDLDADSLRAIEILVQVEKKLKIKIPQEELLRMNTLSGVYAVVEERLIVAGA